MQFLILMSVAVVIEQRQVDVTVPQFGCKGVAIFAEKDISVAKVECYQHPFGGPDIEQVEIPYEDVLELTNRFRRSKVDSNPNLTMFEICSIRIIDIHGRSQRICVFWGNAKQKTICFSINGVRCICLVEARDDEGKPLDHALIVDGKIRTIVDRLQKK